MKKSTATITLSAACVALGVTAMFLGSLFDVMELTAMALASLLVFFAHRELPSPSSFLIFASTAVLSFVLSPGGTGPLLYLAFGGWYPILRHYIENLPRPLAWTVKYLLFNLAAVAVLAVSFFAVGLPPEGVWLYPAVLALGNVAFFFYDILLSRSVFWFAQRLRPILDRILRK